MAAMRAKETGFDGVELHNGNGYLVDTFLQNGTNKRTDAYGGSLENRVRFSLEILEAMISVWGPGRVGIRVSPNGQWGNISDSNPEATFGYFAARLNEYEVVIAFWKQAGPQRWFMKDEAFDNQFREAFSTLHFRAARRELEYWMATPEGALALLILLDQYPRNAFRGTAHMFATDPLACFYARQMVYAEMDKQIESSLRMFCYLPFEHSENADDQRLSLRHNRDLDQKDFKWAQEHAEIIDQFGRFPHRNDLLGRATTAE